MAFAVFGPGSLYITRKDISNATPVNIGFAQEFSLDEAAETKELFGQNQYALVAARGTIKTTGKAKAAEISGLALNAAFHGSAGVFSSGQLLMAQNEPNTVPVTPGPYTVSVINAATFDTDLGVVYAANNIPLTNVGPGGSLTADGQYKQTAGVYTFFSGDQNAALLITYAYTKSGAGQTKIVTNQPIGTSPTFQLDYSTVLNGNHYYLRIFQCISSKLAQSFKLTDFVMPEVDFDVFANAAGQVYQASYADIG